MAVADWTILSPQAGSGNGSVNVSASEHTGRLQRTTEITVVGAGVAEPEVVTAVQTPKAEFVSFNDGQTLAVSKDGGAVTLAGLSNSAKLKYEWLIPEGHLQPEYDDEGNEEWGGIDFPTIELPATYLANGAETANDAAIDGDPGATAEFPTSITLQFPANEASVAVNRVLKITAEGGQTAQIKLHQAAGAAYLRVTPKTITIPQAGTPAVAITIESNTTWTVS